MIELGCISCFLAVHEETSFSRAATRLGIAQPVVSQRLRRLEDQLHIKLLDRTSRRVSLSPQGREFLPFARSMIEAAQAAENAALNIRARVAEIVRLGTNYSLAEERLELIADFLRIYPQSRVDVTFGTRRESMARLRSGEIDVCVAYALPHQYEHDLAATMIGERIGHIAVPVEHDATMPSEVTLPLLSGRTIVVPPGREDSSVIAQLYDRFVADGLNVFPAPEPDARSIQSMAKMRGGLFVQWYPERRERHEVDGFVIHPLGGEPLKADLVLYSQKPPTKPVIQRFHSTAQRLAGAQRAREADGRFFKPPCEYQAASNDAAATISAPSAARPWPIKVDARPVPKT